MMLFAKQDFMTSSDQCVLNEVRTARGRWSEGAADSSMRCYGGPVAQAGIEWRLEHSTNRRGREDGCEGEIREGWKGCYIRVCL
jgi:hypothetical protein